MTGHSKKWWFSRQRVHVIKFAPIDFDANGYGRWYPESKPSLLAGGKLFRAQFSLCSSHLLQTLFAKKTKTAGTFKIHERNRILPLLYPIDTRAWGLLKQWFVISSLIIFTTAAFRKWTVYIQWKALSRNNALPIQKALLFSLPRVRHFSGKKQKWFIDIKAAPSKARWLESSVLYSSLWKILIFFFREWERTSVRVDDHNDFLHICCEEKLLSHTFCLLVLLIVFVIEPEWRWVAGRSV